MVQVTERATAHIAHLRRQKGQPDTAVVRLARNEGQLQLSFRYQPVKGDAVIANGDTDIYLEAGLPDALGDNAVIDARTQDERTWLILRQRPA